MSSDAKADAIPQELMDRADEVGAEIYGRHHQRGFIRWPLISQKPGHDPRTIIARALYAERKRATAAAANTVAAILAGEKPHD